MSDNLRTEPADAGLIIHNNQMNYLSLAQSCTKLAANVAEAMADAENVKNKLKTERNYSESRDALIEQLKAKLAEAQAEIARLTLLAQNQETVIAAQRRSAITKDKLIEKLTESLIIVKAHMHKTNDFYALDDVNAALSAAGRG